jgi:hypothetical protein
MTKTAGSGSESESGSINQRHGSADPDPDPHQNGMDPQQVRKRTHTKENSIRDSGCSGIVSWNWTNLSQVDCG